MISAYSVDENPSADLWESFLSTFSEGNLEHSFDYGEVAKAAFPHTRTARIAITEDGRLVGIVQGTYSRYFGFGMDLGVMRGPLVDPRNGKSLQLVEYILKALGEYAKKNRIIHARILVPEKWQLQKVFHKLGYASTNKLNEYVVNLENGIDTLWKNIAHNKRRNISKALKEGVQIVQSRNHEDLLTFYSLLEAAKERGGFSTYPLSWFEAVWKILKPEELSKVFLSRWKGKSVSGVFVAVHGKTVYALAAGSISEGWKVRPNDIMHWKIMEWACQSGYSKYHMGLVSEPPPSEGSNAWGIWRWKKEWNGNLEGIIIFDKVLAPRYKLVLQTKKLIERSYSSFRH